ncbi:MAG: aminodeoxychorismate/anthranilate synthase component II [Planctomycetaceae bacterium]|jgi:anthranilate synthase/aminodeoxychorismate synthase-like glutamine amidotransferase|nr:aminodeoxychorismate/anthranilate synthase component II [Planctomycetaceae bacterium]MBT6155523.1 aminodeoxychorismate/anthranilate synthase component II [Planctomycetaceae bacterium]MBT6485969.1 aminodeoxychorismate/anthranilate synthase component II [Planctomycetaceae bacterium]MBT6497049.1 aminodeoxychorismate/anthranilate synthase component II [Planctomycetaceae bacterium]
MILLIDNYDSFVYNLARYFRELGCETRVVRNDAVTVGEVRRMDPTAVVLSPGPRTPLEAGISVELVRSLSPDMPILGVCLGFQAIAAALGASIIRAPEPVHGRTSTIRHSGQRIFTGLPNPLEATRYHSLIVDETTLPEELVVTARTVDGIPMALEHRQRPVVGVQFHPESILTEAGHQLLSSFLRLAGIEPGAIPAGETPPREASGDWTTPTGQPLHW